MLSILRKAIYKNSFLFIRIIRSQNLFNIVFFFRKLLFKYIIRTLRITITIFRKSNTNLLIEIRIFEKAIIKTIYYLCRDRETSSIMAFAIYSTRKEKVIVVDATSTNR